MAEKGNTSMKAAHLALAILISAAQGVLAMIPKPVDSIDGSELSAGFYVTFAKLPSVASPVSGPFAVTADKDGRVTVTFHAAPTDLAGDFSCSTVTRVKAGERHHVELSYSKMRRRAALFLDGAFEFENDRKIIPILKGGKVEVADRKAVQDLRLYPYALPAEELTPAGDGSGKMVADIAREKLDAEKRRVFADVKGPAAIYVVPPLSQEMFLPYDLPKRGRLGGAIEVYACPDQQVAGSLLVFALKAPLTIGGAEVGDLQTPDGKVFDKANVDVQIVKRWFRAGGAWLSYHGDMRQRNLTPDLLMHDDAAIKVDELAARNYIRCDYPEGTRYIDVSDPDVPYERWSGRVPFHDAETLQPLTIGEWGRNQQFMVTFTVPKGQAPGLYSGTLELKGAGKVAVTLEVLPIDLPEQGSPAGDLSKSYISLNNSFPSPLGPTLERRRACALATMRHIRAHGMFHTSHLWDSPVHARLAREAGFGDPDRLFSEFVGSIPDWRSLYPGRDPATLSLDDKEAAFRVILRGLEPALAYRRDTFARRPEDFVLFYSESAAYLRLVDAQEGQAELARRAGFSVYSHLMDDEVVRTAADVMDSTATTTIKAPYARLWNAAGGELINYADPFPSSENPEYFRRRVGAQMYTKGLAGDMLHECYRELWPFHEFREGGEIGGYRNFEMCIPTQDAFIWKMAYDGMREAMNDVRYFTALKRLATKYRDSADEALRREARRQLLWLAAIDGDTADLDMLRAATAARILTLQELVAKKEGK